MSLILYDNYGTTSNPINDDGGDHTDDVKVAAGGQAGGMQQLSTVRSAVGGKCRATGIIHSFMGMSGKELSKQDKHETCHTFCAAMKPAARQDTFMAAEVSDTEDRVGALLNPKPCGQKWVIFPRINNRFLAWE